MLLNILQCIGHPLAPAPIKNYPAPNINSVKVKSPCPRTSSHYLHPVHIASSFLYFICLLKTPTKNPFMTILYKRNLGLILPLFPLALTHFFHGSYLCMICVCMWLCLFTNCLSILECKLCEGRDTVPFVPYSVPNVYNRGCTRYSVNICWDNE